MAITQERRVTTCLERCCTVEGCRSLNAFDSAEVERTWPITAEHERAAFAMVVGPHTGSARTMVKPSATYFFSSRVHSRVLGGLIRRRGRSLHPASSNRNIVTFEPFGLDVKFHLSKIQLITKFNTSRLRQRTPNHILKTLLKMQKLCDLHNLLTDTEVYINESISLARPRPNAPPNP